MVLLARPANAFRYTTRPFQMSVSAGMRVSSRVTFPFGLARYRPLHRRGPLLPKTILSRQIEGANSEQRAVAAPLTFCSVVPKR